MAISGHLAFRYLPNIIFVIMYYYYSFRCIICGCIMYDIEINWIELNWIVAKSMCLRDFGFPVQDVQISNFLMLTCMKVYCYTEFWKKTKTKQKQKQNKTKTKTNKTKQKKNDRFLLFLKPFSWDTVMSLSNARWFYGTKRKIWKGNLYLSENWFRNEMWCGHVR